ncbi:MAG: SH3 domain-containing protein [Pseudomonadota bacterium]
MRHWLVGAALHLVLAGAAQAQDDCYLKVVDFAEGICAEFVGTSGSLSRREIDAQIDANLAGLVKRLADLGGEVSAGLSSEEYENIVREDIPDALEQGRQCRLSVATTFFDRICGVGPQGAVTQPSATAAAAAAQIGLFDRMARIEDPDGWTNIRSGKGTNFDVIGRVYEGEAFYTHGQAGTWWQIRTASGLVGYMHTSRIVLLPPS